MLNTTHALAGVLIARSGTGKPLRHAILIGAIAANLPDIDVIVGLPGSASYVAHHRGITHGLLGIAFLSIVFSAAAARWTGDFRRTLLLVTLAMLTHPLLDYANTYGVQPFLPFSKTRYYGDFLFVIDPWLDSILLIGILTARHLRKHSQLAALAGMAAALVYVGARVELRNAAFRKLAEVSSAGQGETPVAVVPQMLNPLAFTGIVETPDVYRIRTFNILESKESRQLGRVHETVLPRFIQPEGVTFNAAQSRSAATFREFARFPAVRVWETETGYRVLFLDARFYNTSNNSGFAAEVVLDRNLRIVQENVGFRIEDHGPLRPVQIGN